MKTATQRPSAKIFALSIAAFLIVGSAVYLKFFSPAAQDGASTLSYENALQAAAIDPVAQALQNELLKPPSTDTAFVSEEFGEDDNLTTRFAKSTFASYMSLQNAGASDADSQEVVVKNMVDRASVIEDAPKYSLAQIKVFTPKNKDEIRNYGNSFSKIINDYLGLIAKDPKKYSSMNAIADLYEKISEDLHNLPAPKDLASSHLQMTNYFFALSKDYRTIEIYKDDPLKALLAIKEVKKIDEESPKLFAVYSNYFKDNGILFTKDEAGVGFTQ